MSLPRSVAELLREHVSLEVEGIDRIYLNVYQPWLSLTVVWLRSSAFAVERPSPLPLPWTP